MAKRYLFVIFIIQISLIHIYSGSSGTSIRKQILDNTVTITMVAPEKMQSTEAVDEALPIPNDEYRPIVKVARDVVAEGLGTVVHQGGELLVVTHDHWSLLERIKGMVRIGTSSGDQLLEMELSKFKEFILYRDGGTMVLEASEWAELGDTVAAQRINPMELSNSDNRVEFVTGDFVQVVQRSGLGVGAIMQARVERADQKEGRGVLRLRIVSGQPLVGGDSGGGVWYRGKLLGNVWTTVTMRDADTGADHPTDMGVAALFPAEYAS
jgi:hypothetical protein